MLRALFLAVAAILAGASALVLAAGSAPTGAGDVRTELMATPVTTQLGGGTTRVAEMAAFTEKAPSILAATNLIGSGLDIPAADLIIITDSDAFGESEIEQLIGRVGRRERPSDAVLLVETTFEKNPSRAMGRGRAQTFMPRGMRANKLKFRR